IGLSLAKAGPRHGPRQKRDGTGKTASILPAGGTIRKGEEEPTSAPEQPSRKEGGGTMGGGSPGPAAGGSKRATARVRSSPRAQGGVWPFLRQRAQSKPGKSRRPGLFLAWC